MPPSQITDSTNFFCPFGISYFADSEMGRKRKGERKSFSSYCKVAYLGKSGEEKE